MAGEKVDLKTLEGQVNLTDEQSEKLGLEAIEEAEVEERKTKGLPPLNPEKKEEIRLLELSDDELVIAKEEDLSVEQKTKRTQVLEERRKKEEERLLSAKEEDLNAEDKTKRTELVKAQEEVKNKTVQEEIKTYAQELGISEEEAKEDLERISKIQAKYKNDPKQLAKANLYIQRLYTRTQEELKSLKDAKSAEQSFQEVTIEAVMKYMETGKVTTKEGKTITKEQIIEAYREANLDITETLDDDKVFQLAAKDYRDAINKSIIDAQAKLGSKAKEKRETLLNSLSEADKKFLPEIKPLIEKLSDTQVMHESFNIETYITYAKGKLFDTTLQQLEKDKREFGEKEYKRGVEEAKILGIQKPPEGKPPKSKEITLTESQKKRAREMFDNPEITDDKAYQLYADLLADGYKEE